ncbi:hypothetical protein PPERSA_01140 [Pseudocohnilembus persalinus]|uniref:Uncharacterized protein n=1 Tax=Pseudocohnilembus persalinus TaxID=266149 RepID=A0A0V0QV23_PSEPJ|nr:hypothetical protein PPERSA_01140 [Pseudocohnilembus persalinus]|eukprot:KRX06062.1 hypothetical protein PPERSA_01140 [Pseudocohnilembus persalinus]
MFIVKHRNEEIDKRNQYFYSVKDQGEPTLIVDLTNEPFQLEYQNQKAFQMLQLKGEDDFLQFQNSLQMISSKYAYFNNEQQQLRHSSQQQNEINNQYFGKFGYRHKTAIQIEEQPMPPKSILKNILQNKSDDIGASFKSNLHEQYIVQWSKYNKQLEKQLNRIIEMDIYYYNDLSQDFGYNKCVINCREQVQKSYFGVSTYNQNNFRRSYTQANPSKIVTPKSRKSHEQNGSYMISNSKMHPHFSSKLNERCLSQSLNPYQLQLLLERKTESRYFNSNHNLQSFEAVSKNFRNSIKNKNNGMNLSDDENNRQFKIPKEFGSVENQDTLYQTIGSEKLDPATQINTYLQLGIDANNLNAQLNPNGNNQIPSNGNVKRKVSSRISIPSFQDMIKNRELIKNKVFQNQEKSQNTSIQNEIASNFQLTNRGFLEN